MRTTNPGDFLKQISIYKTCLEKGLIDKQEVIAWADSIVVEEEEPDYFFIELSLVKNRNEAISILSQYFVETNDVVFTRFMFGLVYQELNKDHTCLDKAVSILFSILYSSEISDAEKKAIYIIDHEYDYRETGLEPLILLTLRFLEAYKDFTLENIAEWENISLKIDRDMEALLAKQKEQYLKYEAAIKPWYKFW